MAMIYGYDNSSTKGGNIQLKQGYLHIKRERNTSRITKRALSKPWQRAYFILYQEPIYFEEYKDASLKQRKHIHILTLIKHVGHVKTSRSKQHAFEIIDEKISLLLACENQSLLEEWVRAFIEVMNKRKMQSSISISETPIENSKEFPVEIVETTLSGMNNLHGEYMAVITNTRMYLRDPDEGDILSWPLAHIAGHRWEASQNKVILVLGKHCHFGNGKLIFQTKDFAQIISLLSSNIGEKRRKLHSTLSSPEVSPIRSPVQKPGKFLSDSSDMIIEEEDDNGIIFGGNPSTIKKNEKTNLQRIKSCPNIQNESSNVAKATFSDFMTMRSMQDSCPNLDDPTEESSPSKKSSKSSQSSLTKLKLQRSPIHRPTSFPEPSTDNGYIPPHNLNLHLSEEENKPSSELLLATTPSPTVSPLDQPSLNDTDPFSYPYLHIIDDDHKDPAKTADQIEHIRSTVIDELANPQQKTPRFAPIGIETHLDERRPSSPLPMRKNKKLDHGRRPSEPVKKIDVESFRNKPKLSSLSMDVGSSSYEVRKQTSPRLSPKQTPQTHSLPKIMSMQSKGDVFQQTATTCLLQNPVFMKSLTSSSGSLSNSRSRPTSRDLEEGVGVELDTPPPLPSRGSPDLIQRLDHDFTDVTITIREGLKKDRRNTMSDIDRTITVNSWRSYNPAPPIPPKTTKTLSLQRSTAICESKDESSLESSRRSSYAEENSISADEINLDDCPSTPPAVPKRDKLKPQIVTPEDRPIEKHLSKKHKRPSPLASKPPMSKSLDSLSFSQPAHLAFPEEEEINPESASPPPVRRYSPPSTNSPPKQAILLDGDDDIPSISVTKLTESEL